MASAARVTSARRLAAEQARIVERSHGGAHGRDIDLLFLLQESVLVFDETHCMLKALAAREDRIDREGIACKVRPDSRTRRPRPFVLAAKVGALVIASAFLIELVDPAPMDVLAFLEPAPWSVRWGHPLAATSQASRGGDEQAQGRRPFPGMSTTEK